MNHEFFIEYKRGLKMFAKSKQTIDKESANKAGKTTYEETNQKTILDEINMASEENLIPPKVKSPLLCCIVTILSSFSSPNSLSQA